MLVRSFFVGLILIATVFSTGCCCRRCGYARCCAPACCPTACCYEPAPCCCGN